MTRASETAIGIDFGGTKIEVALAGTDGALLERERLETRAELGPHQALERAAAAVRRMEALAREAHGASVTGYAAVAPGIVQRDRILLTPNLPGWEALSLAGELQALLKLDRAPAVGNDVRSGALAELRFGALRGVDPGLYVSLGTGIGAAVTAGGTVLAGANQAAGEIAYIDPGLDRMHDDPRSRPRPFPRLQRPGAAPLEEFVGGKAIGDRASARLGARITAAEVFAKAAADPTDEFAHAVVSETLDVLARALANITVLIDPELIVLGGGMMGSADLILTGLRERLAADTSALPFPPRLAVARFTRDASLHGAVALALEHSRAALYPRPLDVVHIAAVSGPVTTNSVEGSQVATGGSCS